ncbi:MAG: DegV family EDD domain-containing protein [Aerococcus sp.]|nr:DegV family EDD domain-containing protein [Aerococcus sp.]
MKAAVLTDGTFELPQHIMDRADHFGFNLSINFANGETINQNINDDEMIKFYDMIDEADQLPTTSQVPLTDLYAIYDQLVEEGYDTVFVAVIPTGLSGTLNSIQNVARDYEDKISTRILSHRSIVNALSHLTLCLYDDIDQGLDADTIEKRMNWLDSTHKQWAIVGSMDQLVKGGRASRFAGFMGNLMHIVPLVKSEEDGGLNLAGKAHTVKRAAKKIIQLIEEEVKQYPEGGTIQIFQADNMAGAKEVEAELKKMLPDNFDTTIEWLSPVIAVHIGRGTVGFSVLPNMANYKE